jgi:hypothetical protein
MSGLWLLLRLLVRLYLYLPVRLEQIRMFPPQSLFVPSRPHVHPFSMGLRRVDL